MTAIRACQQMSEELDDRMLILRAKRGDREAFDQLVRSHLPRVYGLLKRIVGNHEDAEDLAQDTFTRAYFALQGFREDSAFTTWIYRIAVHLGRDLHRSRRRKPPPLSIHRLAPGQALAAPAASPIEVTLRGELAAGVAAALELLPYRLRVVLVLRVFEGLAYADIARVAGITEGTARVQVVKARQLLMRVLQPMFREQSP
ncbi:MAG: sigma-70 family RNA polymerase sigma factor [Planctomycetota bacterium]